MRMTKIKAAKAYAMQDVFKALIKRKVIIGLVTSLKEIDRATEEIYKARKPMYDRKGAMLSKEWNKQERLEH